MVKLKALKVESPRVLYNGTSYRPNVAEQLWHPGGHNFFGGSASTTVSESGRFYGHILVLITEDRHRTIGTTCARDLVKTLTKHGVKVYNDTGTAPTTPTLTSTSPDNHAWFTSNIHTEIVRSDLRQFASDIRTKIKTKNPVLVMYQIPDKTSQYGGNFATFKKVMDQSGIHSICISNRDVYTASKKNRLTQYISNVALKANVKLGYVNHSVELTKEEKAMLNTADDKSDTLILGADVTHAQSNSPDSAPSIAAVVGGVDATFGRFLGSVRYQEAKKEVSY